MEYKSEYKNNIERDQLMSENSSLFLIEEQNITEGNFLIFSDVMPQLDMPNQELNSRVSDISIYLNNSDESTISDMENSILEIEKNKILEGMM